MVEQANTHVQKGAMVKAVPSYKYHEQKLCYTLTKKLGEGLDGKTYLAKRKELEGQPPKLVRKYFCIKRFEHKLKQEGDQNPLVSQEYLKAKNKLVNELVGIVSIQNSQYVLQFEEFVKTDNNMWLVTQYCNGGNLEKLIRENPNGLPWFITKNFMSQMIEAFNELLSKNYIQQDLSPDNIMLHYQSSQPQKSEIDDPRIERDKFYEKLEREGENCHLKMIDFANIVELKEEGPNILRGGYVFRAKYACTDDPIGKLDYLPPSLIDQVFKQKNGFKMSQQDSQWTIGVILCEMLTGKHPFQFLNPYKEYVELMQKAHDGFIEKPSLDKRASLYYNCHRMDHYLLDLPDQFDVECINLLQFLLQSVTQERQTDFSSILEQNFFKQVNPSLTTKEEYKRKYPTFFIVDQDKELFILRKI